MKKAYALKHNGDVVLEACLKQGLLKGMGKHGEDVVPSKDLIPLIPGGSGFSIHNKTEVSLYRPVLEWFLAFNDFFICRRLKAMNENFPQILAFIWSAVKPPINKALQLNDASSSNKFLCLCLLYDSLPSLGYKHKTITK